MRILNAANCILHLKGKCDLVFTHAPEFANGAGLCIHARTKIQHDHGCIESAAMKIGEDIFQVSSYGKCVLNGVSRADLNSTAMSGFPIAHRRLSDEKHSFAIDVAESKRLS